MGARASFDCACAAVRVRACVLCLRDSGAWVYMQVASTVVAPCRWRALWGARGPRAMGQGRCASTSCPSGRLLEQPSALETHHLQWQYLGQWLSQSRSPSMLAGLR